MLSRIVSNYFGGNIKVDNDGTFTVYRDVNKEELKDIFYEVCGNVVVHIDFISVRRFKVSLWDPMYVPKEILLHILSFTHPVYISKIGSYIRADESFWIDMMKLKFGIVSSEKVDWRKVFRICARRGPTVSTAIRFDNVDLFKVLNVKPYYDKKMLNSPNILKYVLDYITIQAVNRITWNMIEFNYYHLLWMTKDRIQASYYKFSCAIATDDVELFESNIGHDYVKTEQILKIANWSHNDYYLRRLLQKQHYRKHIFYPLSDSIQQHPDKIDIYMDSGAIENIKLVEHIMTLDKNRHILKHKNAYILLNKLGYISQFMYNVMKLYI